MVWIAFHKFLKKVMEFWLIVPNRAGITRSSLYFNISISNMYLIVYVKCLTRLSVSKASLQHDANTTILYSWNGGLQLVSFIHLLPNITVTGQAVKFFVSSDQKRIPLDSN